MNQRLRQVRLSLLKNTCLYCPVLLLTHHAASKASTQLPTSRHQAGTSSGKPGLVTQGRRLHGGSTWDHRERESMGRVSAGPSNGKTQRGGISGFGGEEEAWIGYDGYGRNKAQNERTFHDTSDYQARSVNSSEDARGQYSRKDTLSGLTTSNKNSLRGLDATQAPGTYQTVDDLAKYLEQLDL